MSSNIERLKQCESLKDLAQILGYKAQSVSYILYKLDVKYSTFTVAKKSGGDRTIDAPKDRLKSLQRKLADLLYGCIEDLKPEQEKLNTFQGTDKQSASRTRAKKSLSHGYQKGLSIATNAELHLNKRYVFNADLKDFFPTINFGRVRGFFIKNDDFRLHPKVATVIAQIACFNNSLPQGSPCSPVISNLIAKQLDFKLLKLAMLNDCTYTRYVDDITFSCNRKSFPKSIAKTKGIFRANTNWNVGKKLESEILAAGFSINKRKCRMQQNTSRQEVTGLVVNTQVNVSSTYYRSVRSMCQSMFKNGFYHTPQKFDLPNSKPSPTFFKALWRRVFSAKKKVQQEPINIKQETSLNKLNGMIAYIYNIKSYRNRFATPGFRPHKHDGIRTKHSNKEKYPPLNRYHSYTDECHVVALDGIKNLYQRFLMFKHFYLLDKPLIVCEGKTDNIYLKSAIDALAAKFPALAKDPDGNRKVAFFNRNSTNSEMLSMAEGTSGLSYLIDIYKRFFKRFSCEGKKFPVIIVVDDDDAGRGIYRKAQKLKKVNPHKHTSYVFENLYVLKLPQLKAGVKDTEIEDYFESSVLNTKLKGKVFNRNNKDPNNATEYGKDYFSRYVVLPNKSTIDFTKFEPLLNELQTIVNSYQPTNLD